MSVLVPGGARLVAWFPSRCKMVVDHSLGMRDCISNNGMSNVVPLLNIWIIDEAGDINITYAFTSRLR